MKKRTEMLEKYQQERITFIKGILPLFADKFILKGGTALSLYYGLNRYSEDLDFDSKSNSKNFINALKIHKDFKQWKISIRKDTEAVFRAMIDYGAESHLGAYPLKIEISSRNKFFLQNDLLKYSNKNGVNVYDIDELIKMKVIAFGGRDKIRDFYDLGFLLQKYPQYFSKESLLSIYEKISYAGVEELNLLLNDEIAKHKLVSNGEIDVKHYAQNMLKFIEELQTQSNHNNLMQQIEQAERDRQRSDKNYKSGMNKIHENKNILDNSIEQSNTNKTKKKR